MSTLTLQRYINILNIKSNILNIKSNILNIKHFHYL